MPLAVSRKNHVLITFMLLLFTFAGVAMAQAGKAAVSGIVVDDSGASLPGAQIKLSPLSVTGVSNEIGDFTLPDLPAGKYTLTASYIGFEPQSMEIEVVAGQPLNVTVKMKVANNSEAILVTAERPHGEAEAINETRTAENILQVLPAEVIVSLPNANVADAIGRLPAVTL